MLVDLFEERDMANDERKNRPEEREERDERREEHEGHEGHRDRFDREHEPPHTTTGKITAPKFGSAGSGGAELEPIDEDAAREGP
jgi:hypothetical protein